MKISIFCLLALFGGPLHATLDCEHYLVKEGAEAAAHVLTNEVYGQPAKLVEVIAVQPPALHRLGFLELPQENSVFGFLQSNGPASLYPIQFVVEQFDGVGLTTTINLFPDFNPTLWWRMWGQSQLSIESLFEKTRPIQVDHRETSYIGFHSDPVMDGTRTYITVHRLENKRINQIELGVDVPCDLYDLFAAVKDVEIDRPLRVRTNAVEYCRIPVLKFEAAL